MSNASSPREPSAPAQPTAGTSLSQDAGYRPISSAAIGVLVASFLSPLAFLSPLLWILPLGLVVAALWILRSLASDTERLTGSRLAWTALIISALVLGWAPARYLSRMSQLYTDAKTLADAWVEMVNERDLRQAHQWHLLSAERAAPGTDLKDYYAKNAEKQKEMQQFFERDALVHWLSVQNTKAQYVDVVKENHYTDAEEYFLHYEVTGTQNGKPVEFPAYVVVVRRQVAPGDYEMHVGHVSDFDPIPLNDN